MAPGNHRTSMMSHTCRRSTKTSMANFHLDGNVASIQTAGHTMWIITGVPPLGTAQMHHSNHRPLQVHYLCLVRRRAQATMQMFLYQQAGRNVAPQKAGRTFWTITPDRRRGMTLEELPLRLYPYRKTGMQSLAHCLQGGKCASLRQVGFTLWTTTLAQQHGMIHVCPPILILTLLSTSVITDES